MTAKGTPTPSITHTGSLPPAVTLGSTGVLSGTPKVTGTLPHNYVVTISATNTAGKATQKFTLAVLGFHVSTTGLPNGTAGKAYAEDHPQDPRGSRDGHLEGGVPPEGLHPEHRRRAGRDAEQGRQDRELHRLGVRPPRRSARSPPR